MREDGLAHRTCNHALRAIKSFSRWLALDKRIAQDPIASLTGFNSETDPKHQRRELTDDEITKLVGAAEANDDCAMGGQDRAMLYRLALGTGFRASELRSLTPKSFDLTSDPPTVTVTAACSKRRRLDVQPIRSDLAKLLSDWLSQKPSQNQVFTAMPQMTGRMIRSDLKRAGIPYADAEGRVADFHALR